MSNIDKQAVQAVADLKAGYTLGHADVEIIQQMALDAVTLLDELADAEKKAVEIPSFDGYVPHVARELQAAFLIACNNAGINVAAAGKGEAS